MVIITLDEGKTAAHVMETVRARLADEVREHGVPYKLSCAIGYARCDTSDATIEGLVAIADRNLYKDKAKKA